MIRKYIVLCLLLLLCLAQAVRAETKAEKNFKKLSTSILENLQKYWPVYSTYMGIHRYDGKFTDYSKKGVKKEYAELKKFLQRLHKYKTVKLPLDTRIDVQLLKSNCEIGLLRLGKLAYHENNPNIYISNAIDGINYILLSDYVPLESRLDDIISRIERLDQFLAQAEINLKNPPPIWLKHARENINEAIHFYGTVTIDLVGRFPDRSDEIKAASAKALQGMGRFKLFLLGLEAGKPGSFAIGSEFFDYILKRQHLFDFDSDSLLKIGENLLAEAEENYNKFKKSLDEKNLSPAVDIYIPASISKSDIIEYYRWEIEALRKFIAEKNLLTLPENIGVCEVTEAPQFLQGVIGGVSYQPAGAFDNSSTAYFYVPSIPETLSMEQRKDYYHIMHGRRFRGTVVHEAYPGHHLQLQLAAGHQSEVRRWQMNNCLIEGWAMYCEELVYDSGLYRDDPTQYLRVLRGISFRAARIIVDVKLQTGQFNYEEAVSWMVETLEADSNYIQSEVLRYTMDPGQPMSYLMGKRAIIDLRDKLRVRSGESFDLKSFHDRLLSEGSIPVSFISRKMLQ